MAPFLSLALAAICMTSLWSSVESHGRLWSPPGRATMWRRGFKTPSNVNDNQMFCGGLHHEIEEGYKCGLCGDPYDSDRPHEAGGKYATGTIAATYTQGQEVTLQVDLTANHKGWFEFKLCPTNDYKKKATQECLDRHVIQLADGSGSKLYVAKLGSNMIDIPVKLPADVTCDLCMLQWRYHGGNNWGNSFTNQEEFYGCADVKIVSNNGKPFVKPSTTEPSEKDGSTSKPESTTPYIEPPKPSMIERNCKPTKPYSHVSDMAHWCNMNCQDLSKCPSSHCICAEA